MNKNIKKVEIDGEKVYLRKSFDGYRVVFPWTNEEGKKIWNNILFSGSVFKYVKYIVLGIALVYILFKTIDVNTEMCQQTLSNLTNICRDYTTTITSSNQSLPQHLNLSFG